MFVESDEEEEARMLVISPPVTAMIKALLFPEDWVIECKPDPNYHYHYSGNYMVINEKVGKQFLLSYNYYGVSVEYRIHLSWLTPDEHTLLLKAVLQMKEAKDAKAQALRDVEIKKEHDKERSKFMSFQSVYCKEGNEYDPYS